MKPQMYHTATRQVYTHNAYGDKVVSSTSTEPCHFRYITNENTNQSNEYLVGDAMAWFEPDSSASEGDIYQIDGEFWKVKKVIKARRLNDPSVQFIKVVLDAYGAIS